MPSPSRRHSPVRGCNFWRCPSRKVAVLLAHSMVLLGKPPQDGLLGFYRELLQQRPRVNAALCQYRLGRHNHSACRLSLQGLGLESLGDKDKCLTRLGRHNRVSSKEKHD
jgi:hypothetical protein